MGRFAEDSIEYQLKEMMKKFIDHMEGEIKKDTDINDLIWENKDVFGQVAIETIWEYLGDEEVTVVYEKELKNRDFVFEEEEEEEVEDEEDED